MLHGLTDEPAWPTLRGHLLLLAAAGADPVTELLYATETRSLTSAQDQAAVIDSRIHEMNEVAGGGPLPWLSGIPRSIAADPNWGPYLNARSRLVAELADQVRRNAADRAPAWAAQRPPISAELIADIQVWRAAIQVDISDHRPTGPPQLGRVGRIFQLQLDKRLAATDTRTGREWRQLVAAEAPSATRDPFLPVLTERLSDLTRFGFDAIHLLRSAAAAGPLPDDHPADALWWRILDQLPQTPNLDATTSAAVPATKQRTPTPREQQRSRARSPSSPALGPSR
jgi:hypothetical protein